MTQDLLVPISVGELFDKISILQIKQERILDHAKLANVARELEALATLTLTRELSGREDIRRLHADLRAVNTDIWEAEDGIRDCERQGTFGDRFLAIARSIYRLNDMRAELKKQINLLTSSAVVEEKSYEKY